MKLEKNGWGTVEMILLCLGLLVALFIAIFFISRLYGSLDKAVGNKDYLDLENRLENAAARYILDNKIEVTDNLTINLDTLKNSNLISDFKDKNGHDCDGYVSVTNIDNANIYDGKVSCPNFKSINY